MKSEEVRKGARVSCPFDEEGTIVKVTENLWITKVFVKITSSPGVFNKIGDIVEFTPKQLELLKKSRLVEQEEKGETKPTTPQMSLRQEIELDRLKGDLLIYTTKIAVEGTMSKVFQYSIIVNKEIVKKLREKINKIEEKYKSL